MQVTRVLVVIWLDRKLPNECLDCLGNSPHAVSVSPKEALFSSKHRHCCETMRCHLSFGDLYICALVPQLQCPFHADTAGGWRNNLCTRSVRLEERVGVLYFHGFNDSVGSVWYLCLCDCGCSSKGLVAQKGRRQESLGNLLFPAVVGIHHFLDSNNCFGICCNQPMVDVCGRHMVSFTGCSRCTGNAWKKRCARLCQGPFFSNHLWQCGILILHQRQGPKHYAF
mmetsp:Transcript_11902/g.32998  ORF Transcript_11902/g.32998 Transcript_11902/m.32998 type:complete len:225 (-) Transcript_11902:333-1007(-)